MFALARGKSDTGRRLDNTVLRIEARITVLDGALATIILLGVVLNSTVGWWWADPVAALVIVLYAIREAQHAWRETTEQH
jgi:divalent metal cation (Fe/Co/Zn/Cd) transporter